MAARDPEATKRTILHAVGRVLSRDGFRGLGVNAIAKEAGIGKPLIYRYFGGLPQLLDVFAEDIEFWLGEEVIQSEADPRVAQAGNENFAAMLSASLISYGKFLRTRQVMTEVMAWELVEQNNPLVERLAQSRTSLAQEFIDSYRDDAAAQAFAPDDDLQAEMAILISGYIYMALRARTSETVFGVDVSSEEGWARLDRTLDRLTRALYPKFKPVQGNGH